MGLYSQIRESISNLALAQASAPRAQVHSISLSGKVAAMYLTSPGQPVKPVQGGLSVANPKHFIPCITSHTRASAVREVVASTMSPVLLAPRCRCSVSFCESRGSGPPDTDSCLSLPAEMIEFCSANVHAFYMCLVLVATGMLVEVCNEHLARQRPAS